ncbi:MAG: hypothetical protein R3F41_06240 [Gammaproteobacteria bacterium]|nr:PD40 domain-containing protein [Pseudomonadales bacterium]MCP5348514.1 PD40 domain-containing protein [Pseudomonadales bacterium]
MKPESQTRASQDGGTSSPQTVNYVILGLVVLMAGVQLSDRLLSSGPESIGSDSISPTVTSSGPTFRANLNLPTALMRFPQGIRTRLDFSPDADRLYYMTVEYNPFIVTTRVLDLDSKSTEILAQNDKAGAPVASPDGKRVLLWSPQGIMVMNADGSSNRIIRSRSAPVGWYSNDELMVLETGTSGELSLISTSGSVLRKLTDTNIFQLGLGAYFPFLKRIPGSDLILAASTGSVGLAIYTIDAVSGEVSKVIDNGYDPEYANSGHILFMRANNLWAVPFNAATNRVTGPEAQVVDSVHNALPEGVPWAEYTVSGAGRLVYLKANSTNQQHSELTWTDMQGHSETVPIRRDNYRHPQVSPDGRQVALTVYDDPGGSDIWVYDLERETLGRRTFNGTSSRAIWSADSQVLFYQASMSLRGDIWQVRADGTGQSEKIFSGPARAQSMVANENLLLMLEGTANASNIGSLRFTDDVWVREGVLESEFDLSAPGVSPDGRWLTYASNETGRPEVYVRPWPNVRGGRWQVSSQGGRDPVWSPTGDGLYYVDTESSTVMRSAVRAGVDSDGFDFEPAVAVTQIQFNQSDDIGNYSISPDGRRILHFAQEPEAVSGIAEQGPASFELVENWFTELRRLAPANVR